MFAYVNTFFYQIHTVYYKRYDFLCDMDYLSSFLLKLLQTTAMQVWIVFGLFFLLGLLLYVLSRITRRLFVRAGYPKIDVFVTGWIGTPVHELGHALFCLLFGHTIKDMKLFKPDKADGTLGYITHTYDSKNIYHTIGNFFIGCGPIILGTACVFILFTMFLPQASSVTQVFLTYGNISFSFTHFFESLQQIAKLTWEVLSVVITKQHVASWQFWVIVYVASSISSHMQLSPPDIKTMLRGLLVLVLVMIVVNIVAVVWEFDINTWIVSHARIGYVYGVMLFAAIVSLIFYIVSYSIMLVVYGIAKHKFLSPL